MIDITVDLRFDDLIERGGRPYLAFGDCDGDGIVKLALKDEDIKKIKLAIVKYEIKCMEA